MARIREALPDLGKKSAAMSAIFEDDAIDGGSEGEFFDLCIQNIQRSLSCLGLPLGSVGCSLCAQKCFTGALAMRDRTPEELAAKVAGV